MIIINIIAKLLFFNIYQKKDMNLKIDHHKSIEMFNEILNSPLNDMPLPIK